MHKPLTWILAGALSVPALAQVPDPDKDPKAWREGAIREQTEFCLQDPSLAAVRSQCATLVANYGERGRSPTCIQNEEDVRNCPRQAQAKVDAALRARAEKRARQEEEGRRQAAANQRENDEAAALADLVKDPKRSVPAISAVICHNAEVRAAQKREIDEDVRYAREGGGVIDKEKMYEYQNGLRLGDETNATWKGVLEGRHHAKPMPCDKRLARLTETEEVKQVLPQMEQGLYLQPGNAPWLAE